jgi:methylglyoxal synthase
MIDFTHANRVVLTPSRLAATGTTSQTLGEALGLEIEIVLSETIGGDVQIAAWVVVGEIATVIFFADSLE